MSATKWNVTFKIYREKDGKNPHYDLFTLEVDPDEYVLDVIERVWAFHDRSLTFRHACHHSTCGACGMRVNGVEKLTCITPIRDVTRDGGTVQVDPLRNFPVVSDLVVNMGRLYELMEQAEYPQSVPVADTPLDDTIIPVGEATDPEMYRLNDCIECGLCISACPIATTSSTYLGPAVLAAVQFTGLCKHPELADLVDNGDGVWRCHSVYECSEVCPSFVEPGWRIMDLRKQVVKHRVHQLTHPKRS